MKKRRGKNELMSRRKKEDIAGKESEGGMRGGNDEKIRNRRNTELLKCRTV